MRKGRPPKDYEVSEADRISELAEDCANDQLTLKEYMDPFTGSQYK